MLNIVIPMAGKGERFDKVGYELPKPLIDVLGKPMINRVLDDLHTTVEHKFIFIVRKEHVDHYHIDELLKSLCEDPVIIPITGTTQGQACSALLAKEYINNIDPLMIANCDQYVTVDIDDYLAEMDHKEASGLIMTLTADNPEWSYVKLDENNV